MNRKTKTKSASQGSMLVVDGVPGLTIAPVGTPLTRLNYFDGKRLDAEHLKLEQQAQRRLVQLSNIAGGFGIVHGFDTRLAGGDRLAIGPGQAIDAEGRVLLLPQDVEVSIAELIATSRVEPRDRRKLPDEPRRRAIKQSFRACEVAVSPPDVVDAEPGLWLITIAHAEFLCGEEDVYGKPCEQACVTSVERPYRIEGVVLRARALRLDAPLVRSAEVPLTARHQRSRVASAYFADQRRQFANMISSTGLRSQAWCFGAELPVGEVALGVLSRTGMSNLWFDAWIARRERMVSPARAYWAQSMAMRPWSEFLAQILQFQCQLAAVLERPLIDPRPPEPPDRPSLRPRPIGILQRRASLRPAKQQGASKPMAGRPATGRALIEGGIVELPPAGYLPVDPAGATTIDQQVRRMLGDGVELRFCVVRPDDVARELEGAQHMDRIPLLRGLDDPKSRPPVDILVPDGELVDRRAPVEGLGFRAKLALGSLERGGDRRGWKQLVSDEQGRPKGHGYRGAARALPRPGGGGQLCLAALMRRDVIVDVDVGRLAAVADSQIGATTLDQMFEGLGVHTEFEHNPDARPLGASELFYSRGPIGLWLDMSCEADPFELAPDSSTSVSFLIRTGDTEGLREYRLSGSFRLASREEIVVGGQHHGRRVHGQLIGYETEIGLNLAKPMLRSHFEVEILELVSQPSAGGAAMLVSLQPGRGSMLDNDVIVAWDGEALEVSGLWVAQPLGRGDAELVFSQLERDDAVFEPDDLDHQAAREALAAVAYALDDPGFITEAAAKLFPPSGPDDAEFEVRGVHDWVLFHARHRKQCSFEPSPAPRPRPARYRVYTREVDSPNELGTLSHQLSQDAAQLEGVDFTARGTVEFEPGAATLASSSTDIEPWWPHGDERELAWAGITAGPAGGDQLARARLLALEQSIEEQPPASDEPSKMAKQVLQQVPAVFELGEADGVIVLLTWRPQPVAQVSLYFADEAVLGQLLRPNLPQGVGIDQLFANMSEAVWHVGDVALRGGEIVDAKRDERRSLVPGRLIAYTYEGDPACPRGKALEQLARRVFEDVDVETSDIQLSHIELPPRPNACGDVVLVGVGTVGERDGSERPTTRR